jgi:hypothetical protein
LKKYRAETANFTDVAGLTGVAHAQALSDAVFTETIDGGNNPGGGAYSYTTSGTNTLVTPYGLSVTASIAPTIAPSLYVQIAGFDSGAYEGPVLADASMTYDFEVIGPSGTANIGIAAAGLMSSSNGGPFNAGPYTAFPNGSASLSVVVPNVVSVVSESLCNYECPNPSNSWAVNGTYAVPTNTLIQVSESVSLNLNGVTTNSGYLAQADPTLTLDPSNSAADGYSIVYSPNLTPVPLPASGWLLLGALGVLGCMARKPRNWQLG